MTKTTQTKTANQDRTGHVWAKYEEDLLRTNYEEGTDLAELSFLLGRSEISVKNRLNKLGLKAPASRKVKSFVPQENHEAITDIVNTGRRNLEFFIYNKYVGLCTDESYGMGAKLSNSDIFILLAVMDGLQMSAFHYLKPIKMDDMLNQLYCNTASSYKVKCVSAKEAFHNLGRKPFWTIVGRRRDVVNIDKDLQLIMLDKSASERFRKFLMDSIR